MQIGRQPPALPGVKRLRFKFAPPPPDSVKPPAEPGAGGVPQGQRLSLRPAHLSTLPNCRKLPAALIWRFPAHFADKLKLIGSQSPIGSHRMYASWIAAAEPHGTAFVSWPSRPATAACCAQQQLAAPMRTTNPHYLLFSEAAGDSASADAVAIRAATGRQRLVSGSLRRGSRLADRPARVAGRRPRARGARSAVAGDACSRAAAT